ncbi:MAG: NAD(+) synthase, partial [Fibrobacterota bacterium]
DGGSMVFSGEGKLQAEAARFQEDMLITDIKKSGGIKPVKISRSKNNMGPTAEVYNALVLGIRDYIEKNGFRSAVIGLSGGIDSAVAAALAAASLGSKNVKCISMPTVYSSEGTKSDAEKLASNLGVWFREVPVQEVYDIFKKLMKPDFSGMPEDTAEENLQARIRGTVLMTYSNKFGDIVLTTGNKSETSVGYCTLYGDMAGGFAPLKDVPKTLVYRLASYINRINKRNIIPSGIIKRPPSAELSENQKDSDSLPPYDVLDRIIDCFIEKEMDGRAIVDTGIPEKTVREVLSLIYQNEYKRRQAPPGIKITPIAFGKDRRMPITNRYRF